MAFQERQGRQFTKCEAFWDAQPGETFTGVLIDCNEKFPNTIQGKTATKPLYILKSTGDKDDKASLNLMDDKDNKKAVKNKAGLIVGVFDCDELHVKIFDAYEDTVGKPVRMTYTKKEAFETRDGAKRTAKRFTVLVDHDAYDKNAVVKATVSHSAAAAPNGQGDDVDGDTGPYKVNAPAS